MSTAKLSNGDMLDYFMKHPQKLKEKQLRDRAKKAAMAMYGLDKQAAPGVGGVFQNFVGKARQAAPALQRAEQAVVGHAGQIAQSGQQAAGAMATRAVPRGSVTPRVAAPMPTRAGASQAPVAGLQPGAGPQGNYVPLTDHADELHQLGKRRPQEMAVGRTSQSPGLEKEMLDRQWNSTSPWQTMQQHKMVPQIAQQQRLNRIVPQPISPKMAWVVKQAMAMYGVRA